ncbi:hypothetical protein Trco_002760 [Trichoderma cornu-damae]|uniref:AB hydrolase-1 domain-containing protein n=1 Tax=Trichoderma cornu-damae TaxID=654480 RepID=A0A9P8TZF3_9HYPO|nr:hypothetical protein Trco_002760 [Trichoderma cornu-damae]
MLHVGRTFALPLAEDTVKHPAFASVVWALEPHRAGKLEAAKGRGGPIKIAWEIHGDGPTKVVLIMGLAGVKTSWQRQTKYFGHDRADAYSVLILDNRGIGESDKPLARYTTSAMAADTVDVLDHVGWTAEREVHVVGISMGGMIAQEIACAVPTRLRSLTLIGTTARFESGPARSWSDAIWQRVGFVVPKSEDQGIVDTSRQLFSDEWLAAPDDAAALPSPRTTPRCCSAPGTPDGEYIPFDTNFQRFQAQELFKKRQPGWFTTQGFLCQLIAAGWHSKSPEQLRQMADRVGRERILIMHGTADNMITVPNGEKLIKHVEPGAGLIVEGMGHAPGADRADWFNSLYGIRPVVEEVIVQLAIARAELLLLQEKPVVHEGQGVEDVKLGELGEDEGVVHEVVEAGSQGGLVKGLFQGRVGGVVEEVGDADNVVFGVVDGRRLDAVEGEEVGDGFLIILGKG